MITLLRSFLILALLPCLVGATTKQESVALKWVDSTGVSGARAGTLGVPWPRGAMPKGTEFSLTTAEGKLVPLQSWTLATWPDGSIKWSGHAVPADTPNAATFTLMPGSSARPEKAVKVEEKSDLIRLVNGIIECHIPRSGSNFLSIYRDGKLLASNARLVALSQDKPEGTVGEPVTVASFSSRIDSVTVEQAGPVRAVVKLTGMHSNDGRAWLPFVLRLSLFSGAESVRIMHSFIFDGNENKDFIRGLGVRFDVPLSDLPHDRHVRFMSAEGGVWGEAVKTLTGLRRDPGLESRQDQIEGRAVLDRIAPRVAGNLHSIPTWGDFSLFQQSADSYQIRKRTKTDYCWIDAYQGSRASGTGFVGGATGGGVVFGLRDFWQRHPTQLDIRGADTAKAEVTLWLWSPSAHAMDLRFYHDGLGLDTHAKQTMAMDITYEDYEPGFGTPHGVARSSEITLWTVAATPTRERLAELASTASQPPQLSAEPAAFLKAGVFGGMWTLPDRSTPARAAIEDRLDFLFSFYKGQIEQRKWYGFWNYGDFMHTYDADRHVWRYDVGGYAWDNSELSPDLWLWYSYLRTGRGDIFRVAEAMTRHVSEVDVYHLGRFAGLGSRHNVLHWGCSAKQVRISSAIYRRFYYYLTADERLGDLLRELVNVDRQFIAIDPVRKVPNQAPKGDFPARMSIGTDWCTLAAAWLTEWERTGDTRVRDKLFEGMKGIGASKYGFYAPNYGYDPETGRMTALDEHRLNYSHLNSMFGAVELCAELIDLTKDRPELAGFDRIWMLYCETINATPEEQRRLLPGTTRPSFYQTHSRLVAYAAWRKKDAALAARAWDHFHRDMEAPDLNLVRVAGTQVMHPVDEVAEVSTNGTAQYGLAAIQNMALLSGPEEKKPQPDNQKRK